MECAQLAAAFFPASLLAGISITIAHCWISTERSFEMRAACCRFFPASLLAGISITIAHCWISTERSFGVRAACCRFFPASLLAGISIVGTSGRLTLISVPPAKVQPASWLEEKRQSAAADAHSKASLPTRLIHADRSGVMPYAVRGRVRRMTRLARARMARIKMLPSGPVDPPLRIGLPTGCVASR